MQTQTTIAMLPPEALLVTKNVRFGLKKYRVQALAESIKTFGKVHTNLKVEPLPEPGPHGEKYAVREGHYRHAAALLLNKEGAGIQLPCEIEAPLSGVDRLRYQISENLDRENLSPMDMAIAIRELLEAGMSKVDIRGLFSRPGGRKGLAMQPMSNSLLNIYNSFLDLPKSIQNKIHDGTLGVAAALEVVNAVKAGLDPEKILERAEADRQKAIGVEEKQEEKFLESDRKTAEAEAKAKADAEALKKTQELAAKAEAEAKAKLEAAAEQYKAMAAIPSKDKDAKKKANEAFTAAETAAKAAEKAAHDVKAQAEKLAEKAIKNEQLAKERKEKLEAARKDSAKAAKSVKPEDVKRAAAQESGGPVPLTFTEIRKLVDGLALPGSFPKVSMIGNSLRRCFSGEITDGQLLSELGYITGERKEKPKTFKAAVADAK